MEKNEIFLKMLLAVLLSVVLSKARYNAEPINPGVDIPAIIFIKETGTPSELRGINFQKNFCAAFPISDSHFLTSAHCLATDSSTKTIDLVGLGNVQIESVTLHSKLDLAVIKLKNRSLFPRSGTLAVKPEGGEARCSVLVLNKSLRWNVLQGASSIRCPNKTSKHQICYKADKVPSGLDFVVVCEGNRMLHAVFQGHRDVELFFSVCNSAECLEFLKQNTDSRVKRQADESNPNPPEHEEVKTAENTDKKEPDDSNDQDKDKATEDTGSKTTDDDSAKTADDTVAKSTDDAKPTAVAEKPADTVATAQKPQDSSDSSGSATPTEKNTDSSAISTDMPLPPPSQLFPNMPEKFPYPSINVVQTNPVPTKARKRLGFPSMLSTLALKANSDYSDLSSISLVMSEQVVPSANDRQETESPIMPELTEYDVPATQDSPVEPAAFSNDDAEERKTSTDLPMDTAVIPAAVKQRVQQPNAGGFASAPADWRFSVTPRPQRRCKTTVSRSSCQVAQPYPLEAAEYVNQVAEYQPNQVMPYQPMPNQVIKAAAAGASKPTGPDPWLIAAQKAVPSGLTQPREDEKEPEGPPVESSAKRSGLAIVALLFAKAVYIML